ncbi:TPA: hypothetical protein R1732_001284, partial [Campylobacter lari]|nr:hypothetical protein [Campylobacter lari]
MFFKKKTAQKQANQSNTSKQNNTSNDFAQEKRLYEFRENMKKLIYSSF